MRKVVEEDDEARSYEVFSFVAVHIYHLLQKNGTKGIFMDECFFIFHEYTDEFVFFEKEFVEVCATEPVAEADNKNESYYYQKEKIKRRTS